MMRVLTGIQSTGTPHIGNLLGAILPTIKMTKIYSNPSFILIADLHSLTNIKDSEIIKENTYRVLSAFLAFGLPLDKVVCYKQSDVPEVTELAWYLSCFFSYKRLTLSHSFKEKYNQDISVGLFSYPLLMASDILLFNAKIVTVGKDQLQHLEITRNIADRFNRKMGKIFVLPEAKIQEEAKSVPGTDGYKMSKSLGNAIDIFCSKEDLKNQIMSIQTDSKSLKDPKDPDVDRIFSIYKLLASKEEVEEMRERYLNGGYGYSQAKKVLYELILNRFSFERKKFHIFLKKINYLDDILHFGAKKARKIAINTICKVRKALL
ncbi:MAG TPA: tryptophan--tRNA ligase [Blattabacteriaceae bacterium]